MIAQPLKAMATATISNETMSLEATSVHPAQGNGKRRDAKVVTPAPPNEFGRLGRKSLDRIKTTETLKFSASVGAEGHRRANLSQLRSLLVDVRRQSSLPQRKRERQAANAGPNDADTSLFCGHRECPRWVVK